MKPADDDEDDVDVVDSFCVFCTLAHLSISYSQNVSLHSLAYATNTVANAGAYPRADADSDQNTVVTTVAVKLKEVLRAKNRVK